MSGLAGHIPHIWENYNFSFVEIKNIFNKIQEGKILISEKTDGINVFIGFKESHALVARNKTELLNGGLNLEQIREKKFFNEQIKNYFLESIEKYQEFINKNFDKNKIRSLFENGTIFYNAEIQGPEFVNVIKYDENIINIHKHGHVQLLPEVEKIEQFYGSFPKLLKNSYVVNKDKVKLNFSNEIKETLFRRIDNFCHFNGLSDNNTVEDFLRENLYKSLFDISTLDNLESRIQKNIVENALKKEKLNLTGLSSEVKREISKFKTDSKKNIDICLNPVKKIISEFCLSIFSEIKSEFIAESNKEINRLQEKYPFYKNKIVTNIEGVVFEYNNSLFKLTGIYSELNKEKNKKKIVIFPGSFKPPHLGHFEVVKSLIQNEKIDEIRVIISNKEREQINCEQSLKIWETYTQNFNNIKFQISPDINPMITTVNVIKSLSENADIILIQGEKEDKNRFSFIENTIKENNPNINIEIRKVSMFYDGISGTFVRNLIETNNKETFFNYLPMHISENEKETIWNLVSLEKKSLGLSQSYPIKGIKNMLERNEFLQELKLRNFIKNNIVEIKKKNNQLESQLREYIKKILKEVEVDDGIPQESTGINVLEDLLKRIVPILEDDYKILTTNKEQRISFSSYILNSIENSLMIDRIEDQEQDAFQDKKDQNNIKLSIKEQDEKDKFIDIDKDGKEDTDKIDAPQLPNEDTTGRNLAANTYEKIEKNIIEAFNILDNPDDQEIFYDFLLTNLKLYFEKFEEELTSN